MMHFNPLGWGMGPNDLAPCGAPLSRAFWAGSLDVVNCKKCKALAAERPNGQRPKAHSMTTNIEKRDCRMSEWQPIETAPKDGRFVLLHCPAGQLESGEVTVGAYWKHDERADNGRFRAGNWDGWLGMDVDIASSWCSPSHWMTLPNPPEDPS